VATTSKRVFWIFGTQFPLVRKTDGRERILPTRLAVPRLEVGARGPCENGLVEAICSLANGSRTSGWRNRAREPRFISQPCRKTDSSMRKTCQRILWQFPARAAKHAGSTRRPTFDRARLLDDGTRINNGLRLREEAGGKDGPVLIDPLRRIHRKGRSGQTEKPPDAEPRGFGRNMRTPITKRRFAAVLFPGGNSLR